SSVDTARFGRITGRARFRLRRRRGACRVVAPQGSRLLSLQDAVASRTTSTGRNGVGAASQSMPPTSRPRCSGESAFASSMAPPHGPGNTRRSEEHTSELQSLAYLVCRLLLDKRNK